MFIVQFQMVEIGVVSEEHAADLVANIEQSMEIISKALIVHHARGRNRLKTDETHGKT